MTGFRWRDERGSAAVEITLVAPVLVLFVLVIIFGGRLVQARHAGQSGPFDAAPAASLAPALPDARGPPAGLPATPLPNQTLPCATTQVVPDLTGFTKPVGTPATVTVRVVCEVPVADLGLPGIGGTVTVEETATSALDEFRERK